MPQPIQLPKKSKSTGKVTTNLDQDKWEKVPGTGTGRGNPPKYRMKEGALALQRSKFREKKTAPAVQKVYSRATPKAATEAAEARADIAVSNLYKAAASGSKEPDKKVIKKTLKASLPDKKRTAAPMGISKTDIPVRRKEPDKKVIIKTLKAPLPDKKRTAAPMGISKQDVEKARQRRYMLKTLKESIHGEPSTKVKPLGPFDDKLTEWKKGGKVSRSEGGKVSRKKSKKGKKVSWNGNSEVSRWYD